MSVLLENRDNALGELILLTCAFCNYFFLAQVAELQQPQKTAVQAPPVVPKEIIGKYQ